MSVGPICRSANHIARDRRAGLDHLLADDEPLDRRSAGRRTDSVGQVMPIQPWRPSLLGELLGVAVDPRVVVPAEAGDRLGGHLASTLAEFDLLGCPGEVHRPRCYDAMRRRAVSAGPAQGSHRPNLIVSINMIGIRRELVGVAVTDSTSRRRLLGDRHAFEPRSRRPQRRVRSPRRRHEDDPVARRHRSRSTV